MKLKSLIIASVISATPAAADPVEAQMFGIRPSIGPAQFKTFVTEELSDFRGGWVCATSGATHACYSNTSNIEQLDKTDDALSLIVTDDVQILVASCGVFDACDAFGLDALRPAIQAGDINFPTENATMVRDGPDTIVTFENGAFIVEVSTGYVKMAVGR